MAGNHELGAAAYAARLTTLVRAFLSAANRPGIEKIEPKIYDAFIRGTGNPGEVERQLRRWVETRPDGRHAEAIPAARALYDFLFAGSRGPDTQSPQPSAFRSGSAIEPTLSLTLVHRMATAPLVRLADSEKPKFRIHAGHVLLDPSVEIVQPGAVPVFVSDRDRMIVLESDSLLATLERKADGDRFDAKYARASRMGSANSEDAVTWSLLRTMELRGPAGWFRHVLAKGLERAGNQGSVASLPDGELHFDYWVKVAPPAGLATREGETEFDALIRLGSDTLVSVEAKVGSPFSPRTRYGESRNQFIRNVDVAAEHAARIGRVCWPAVLVSVDDEENIAFVRSYVDDPGRLASALPHRAAEDASALARRVAILAWEDILESAGAPAEAAEAVEVPHHMSPDRPRPDSSESLIWLARSSAVNQLSGFAAVARDLAGEEITRRYRFQARTAPRRHETGKVYLVGHEGTPSTGESTNRGEEHLAMALFNAFGRETQGLPLPDGRTMRIVDYQFPLKARQGDSGVGKVDLIAVDSAQTLVVTELKVGGGTRADTPLRALLEALSYAAVVEANAGDIAQELAALGIPIRAARPAISVMAPAGYWEHFERNRACGDWTKAMRGLAQRVREAVGIETSFLRIGDCSWECGLGGAKPRLTSAPRWEEAF